ncbi:hypothetical protein 2050H1_188 [Serratia phage 2050H1]|uniref:Uncharacterized protein n=1 Tax=Serratia phage 2050H1 TaxID=2024250 RepID=A0A249Y2P1_9CAUD|nr:hypothetical protein 2050H1_188 [Serratia phage 2050H1]
MGFLSDSSTKLQLMEIQSRHLAVENLLDNPEVRALMERMQIRVNRLCEIYADLLQKYKDEEFPELCQKYRLEKADHVTSQRIKYDVSAVLTKYQSTGLICSQEDMEDLFYIIIANIVINGNKIDV